MENEWGFKKNYFWWAVHHICGGTTDVNSMYAYNYLCFCKKKFPNYIIIQAKLLSGIYGK